MSNDPTEYHRPIDPMQAYRNPYETHSPYEMGVPVPPAPPTSPKRRPLGLILASVALLCLVLILGGVIVGIMLTSNQQKVIQPPPTTTSVATSTQVPTASYTANDIYNDFSKNGLGGTNLRNDNNWSCCTYVPEGGGLVWIDNSTGHNISLAIFKNAGEAQVDAQQLNNQNFASTVIKVCLLSYDKAVSASVVNSYAQLMQTYCI